MAYGKARENLIISQRFIACDPLTFRGWSGAIASYIWLGDTDAAIELALKGKEVVTHYWVTSGLFMAYIAAGRFDEAEARIDLDNRLEIDALSARTTLAAARGDAAATKALLQAYLAVDDSQNLDQITLFAIAGEHERANHKATEIDSDPFGYLLLISIPGYCQCGAPFDLAATPNFARLIAAANLPWPPDSPINWPLKDW